MQIPFFSRASANEVTAWLEALNAAMPEHAICAAKDCDPRQLRDTEIAIVANPEPSDLRALPKLHWVHSLWAGVDKIVAELAQPHFQLVRLVDPILARTMAEAALTFCLYCLRDVPRYAAQQRQQNWRELPVRLCRDCTVTILGSGEMGLAAAQLLEMAGFRVQIWGRIRKTLSAPERQFFGLDALPDALAETDILLVLLPLTAETRSLLNAERLALLPKGAQLINFARGAVLDSAALLGALDDGKISHAVLDVFEREPLPQDSPFWSHPSVTVLPHVSAPTNKVSASAIVAGNVRRYLATGALPPTVDFQRGY